MNDALFAVLMSCCKALNRSVSFTKDDLALEAQYYDPASQTQETRKTLLNGSETTPSDRETVERLPGIVEMAKDVGLLIDANWLEVLKWLDAVKTDKDQKELTCFATAPFPADITPLV